ncbi:MAG TPA: hypothetical protein VGQ00_02900 [Candidatus Norongarragalinales archaeon]|jgi:hypothetical protein|nr:hypothetical protein [Candidatus Norongarragalinales archaeon]
MDHLKAVGLGIGIWLVLFAVATAILFTAGSNWISPVMLVLTPILCWLAANAYLKDWKDQQTFLGFHLGVLWVAIGIVLDLTIIVSVLKAGFAFFTPLLFVGYFEIFAVPLIAGYLREHKQPRR